MRRSISVLLRTFLLSCAIACNQHTRAEPAPPEPPFEVDSVFRRAIEDYPARTIEVEPVPPGPTREAFFRFVERIHKPLHAEFADGILPAFSEHFSTTNFRAEVEVAIDGRTGTLRDIGVVAHSGKTAFDIAVVDSFRRALPVHPVPASIVSSDGNVYLRWTLFGDPRFACTTYYVRPFIFVGPVPTASPVPKAG
jgi:hypothetical protein